MGVVGRWEQRLDRGEQNVLDFGLERAHDDGEPPHGCRGWQHLPKEGLHVTFRYVLGDREGGYTKGKEARGDTAWIWEVRLGFLTRADYDLSNTEGDSGKTAVVKTESFKGMTRVYFNPAHYPYGRLNGPYGVAAVARPNL